MLLAQPAHGQAVLPLLMPSPLSIALTVGQWIMKDSRKVYYIEVQSQAPTFEAARAEGFRLAVENAVGSLIISETEVRNNRIVRDEIITYASGYVDRFEIVDRQEGNNRVTLKMKIWVAHSSLANRLLNESRAAGQVEGERVNAQIQTFKQQRQAGDRVLTTVLNDYPRRAFNVGVLPTKIVVDKNRNPNLYVAFDLSWNQGYLTALAEAVRVIGQRTDCSAWLKNCSQAQTVQVSMPGYSSNTNAWFDDDVAWQLMHSHMIQSRPAFQVVIRNPANQVQFKDCFYAGELDHSDYKPWYFVDVGPGSVTVNGGRSKRFEGYIDISNMPVQQFDRVEVNVVRSSQCGN
jgi:hypothetical protein